MKLSDEEKLCLAKAINNHGRMTPKIISNVYSNPDPKSKLQTLEAKGLIRQTDQPAVFMVRIDEDDKGLKWKVPRDVKEMADNIEESQKAKVEEQELLEKYREI